ncbi:hypothetical protein [Streptomyces sp. NBC_00233]|uniref:hypothetical protein n=1 Tax=Streptomyces sp. NBC_00233 TaxID=2975686 RepID=UPI00225646DE|nr:hypothetical protein [Streptomyces sp. NBC_00233]MCX5229678.1 hypothetical protein [Streptomyces sp. NBC_00233]
MPKRTLARHAGLHGSGWAHPYRTGPFDAYLYADGGDGDGSASGSGADQSGGQAADQAGQHSGQTDDTGSAPGQGSGSTSGKDGGEDHATAVKRLEKELADARKEAAKNRTTAKQQAADEARTALAQEIGKALGLVKADEAPDPEKLAAAIAEKDTALTAKDADLRARDVELAVWSRAEKAGAKASALLDSRSFVKTLAGLDPAEKGFTKALDDAITAAVKDNASFAVQTASRSGGDLSGGTGESGAKQRSGSLAGAIQNHYQT